jgi:dephospho-CoA kinase
MRVFVGLTGGIGSGKTAVATRLETNGAVVIDSDVLAREVVEPGTAGLASIVDTFSADVLAPDGSLDRPALGRVVFGDADRRARLEAIIHPLVRARTAEIAEGAPDDAVVVNDVPLLVEAGLGKGFDLVVVVLASEANRLDRIVNSRGVSETDVRARIAAQANDEERRAAADVVIDNDGTLDELYAQVDALWRERLAPPEDLADDAASDDDGFVDEAVLEADLERVTDHP